MQIQSGLLRNETRLVGGNDPLLETGPCFSYDHVSTYDQNKIRHYTMGGGGLQPKNRKNRKKKKKKKKKTKKPVPNLNFDVAFGFFGILRFFGYI